MFLDGRDSFIQFQNRLVAEPYRDAGEEQLRRMNRRFVPKKEVSWFLFGPDEDFEDFEDWDTEEYDEPWTVEEEGEAA